MPGSLDLLHANAGRLLGEMLAEGQVRAEREGDWIGSFQLCELLGEGGFAKVWLAEQFTPVRRKVAVKLTKMGMGTVKVLDDFHLEQQALAIISHPNVVTMIEAGTEPDGRPYFAMEWVNGLSITRWCESAQPPVLERLQLFHQVCLAVHHFHGLGILHLDLKPGNILVASINSRVLAKIIDFGIARGLVAGSSSADTPGALNTPSPGTPCYMSPEQLDGQSDIDVRSDIYSLGLVLHELLTGSLPSDTSAAPRPSSRDLEWITLRALETQAQHRYRNASEFADDVERFINGEAVRARPLTTTSWVSRWIKRNRRLVATAVLGVVVGSGCVVLKEHLVDANPEPPARHHVGCSFPKDGLTNSLGMKFIPVRGTDVLFCIHETRVTDYAAYAAAVPGVDASWKLQERAGIPVGEIADHPVCGVGWEEAAAFCRWLSMKEGRSYRIPTDHEWSLAAGIGQAKDDLEGVTSARSSGAPFHLSKQPTEIGNYADRCFHKAFPKASFDQSLNDGFATTSPVMSFGSNPQGLFDTAGNVWEWVDASHEPRKGFRAARGGGWTTPRPSLSDRHSFPPGFHGRSLGFRVVLAKETHAARVDAHQ